ncbi:nucleopolyhedrovirus P10 family protein [Streptomyces sp. NPDC001595]|uniref:nucleopolyhedrovirus P10 family protein n=1 Tax=Streptomyces sp. NPDC001532 TaxID=3154520 RepID=UPI0033175075
MTADRWTQAVREQLSLGRILPLGDASAGAWIAESAARAVLRGAAYEVAGVRPGVLRLALADPEHVYDPVVPPPPSALPPGPLRLTAEFAAGAAQPLPETAARLRTALATAAATRLGLTVAEVDLRVTDLLDEETEAEPVRPPEPPDAREATGADEARAAEAALAVPGVARLTGTLGALGRAVHIDGGTDTGDGPSRRHVRLELALRADHRSVDVAREVRARVGEALWDHPTVAVLVTAVG